MADYLKSLLKKEVTVVTNDGRHYIGVMQGLDQATNLVLTNCSERVYAPDEGVEVVPMSVVCIRGDNIAIVGEYWKEQDHENLDVVHAHPLKPIVH